MPRNYDLSNDMLRRAEEARRLAETTQDDAFKTAMLKLAAIWEKLARRYKEVLVPLALVPAAGCCVLWAAPCCFEMGFRCWGKILGM
jgi:hypothetical protein